MSRREIELDQYFTRPDDAGRFLSKVDELFSLGNYDVVLEPSAGSGSFYSQMPSHNRVGIDLEPLCDGVEKCDFFDYEPPLFSKIAVVGNPPFGRKGKLAKQFFNHAAGYADVIAFVLPAIFGKSTFTNNLNEWFEKVHEEPVEKFMFPSGETYNVNCVFQIWKKQNYKRKKVTQIKEIEDFTMIHRHIAWTTEDELKTLSKEYDFAYGQISHKIQEVKDLKKGSQFLIKSNTPKEVREIFEQMNFDHLKKYAMGAVSLSRGDVMEEYIRIKNK